MANFVYVLGKGMDATPGGPDESCVPKDARLGQAVDLEARVQLLVGAEGGAAGRGEGAGAGPERCKGQRLQPRAGARQTAVGTRRAIPRPRNSKHPHPHPHLPQVDTTCQTVFNYVAQGLFERHKLIVSTQLCMAVLRARGELQRAKFDLLLRGPKVRGRVDCAGERAVRFRGRPCLVPGGQPRLPAYRPRLTP
jgi:hypothetical protein